MSTFEDTVLTTYTRISTKLPYQTQYDYGECFCMRWKVDHSLLKYLIHWGRVTLICVIKLTKIGSDNGLWPGRRQAIIWTNDGILFIIALRTNFNDILIEIHTFSFKKIPFKMSCEKWRPFCLGPTVLNTSIFILLCNLSSFVHNYTLQQVHGIDQFV